MVHESTVPWQALAENVSFVDLDLDEAEGCASCRCHPRIKV